MKNNQPKVQEIQIQFNLPQIQITQTKQDVFSYTDCVLQVLELEILFKNQQPNIQRKLSLKFQQDGKKFYQNLRLIKQNKAISRYVLIDQEPLNLNQNSINDLVLDICSYEQKKEESWDNIQMYKLLQESEEDFKKNQGKDFWLFRYLNDPLDREIYHYGFLHVVIYRKQVGSYFDYIQNKIKDDISLKCPLYRDSFYYPYFQPNQILLVYKLLSEFNYEWNFQGFYKYQVIENDYHRILNQGNDSNANNEKQFQEYYANIRTFYQFMYVSQMTKVMTYYFKIQNYFWQNFQQNFKDIVESNKQAYLQDLQKISEKIGISIKYRFQTWNEFALLNEKIGKQYKQLVQNYHKIELLKEYQKLKQALTQQYGNDYEQIEQRYVQENKDFVYSIISTICHFHCIHVTPQMLYDLNRRFEQDLIDVGVLFERFNLIAQVIKDIIFIYTFNQEKKYQREQQNSQTVEEADYQEYQIIPQINYHQGLIDIIDKLITLNQTCKSNQDQKEGKFLSNVFWTLYSFYKHVLKYYISSKYRGKHIVDDLFVLNYCFKIHIKDLWDHLDSLYINTDFLFEKSFFSLYANVLSRELLYRVWDIIFLEISRDKIKPRWILISIAMTILLKLKNTLKQAKTVDDVLLLIKNYCSFETNISEFIDTVYEWIDKLFLQKCFEQDGEGEENYESQRYQDEHLIEKLLIQESVMKGFYSKYSVSNTLFEDQYLSKLREICFSKYFLMYETLESEFKYIMKKKQSQKKLDCQPLYQILTNQPQKLHLVIHGFSEVLLDQNDITIQYLNQEFQVKDYLEFDLNQECVYLKQLGVLKIIIEEQGIKYEGFILLDNLFFDQAIKLNVLMEEQVILKSNILFKPEGYFLECSVLIQTCNTYNLNYTKSQRVAFPYFKNLGKKITEDQKNQQYIVNYIQKEENSNQVEAQVFSPMYSNEKFYSELNISEYKSKFDTCNCNMFTQWKINSYIPNDNAYSFVDKLFPTELSRQEKRDLVQQLVTLDNQFYILDLFLICIIYSQEQFLTKASLIFKYLNFFERRSSDFDISDVTVKSFLISLYERMQYYFPSHQIMILENYFKSKAVSQINKVVYQYANGLEDLTSFFKEKIIDQVFEKNLSLNIDLSNPDFLKSLFMKLIQSNVLIGGKLVIEYQLKTYKRQKELTIYYDEQKKSFSLSNDSSQKYDKEQAERDKQKPLIQRLLLQQKNLINFELYDTYTESDFIDLLNQMPLVPLLLTIKNVNVDSPLVIEKDDQNFGYLCRNFNIQLDVKIRLEGQLYQNGENFLVRDNFFNSRRDLLFAQDGQVPFQKYLFLPNINMYNRVQNIAENIAQALFGESYYVKQVDEIDGNRIFRKLRDFPQEQSLFQIEQQARELQNQVLRILDLPDVQRMNSQQQLINKIQQDLKPKIYSLLITVDRHQYENKRDLYQKYTNTTFCRYTFNTQTHVIFLPILNISHIENSKYIVSIQSQQDKYYLVDESDVKSIVNVNIKNKFISNF
ncbi:hypothetical protein TTHERM_001041997 (macronuclear) [Tetrahymena thermophila SB210]|uniref:Rab-GAP TBC domain-containing protein n=1 Tax=Tetrahymena thermophila (strain SB210) TaxID=312017 RepID=W7X1H3_TETTS|nr:hypothetical protein TTHERM_001041997 [Tetrahymena thermophila SB210]EWS71452.1 hypothetical protein TTHERM_001041997 [Tetrahymena thermophila SB210]|eukprot:XP_012656018.1 hypothetical protein TTHERM_001041997 [Tetrahymena thermophila SB210]